MAKIKEEGFQEDIIDTILADDINFTGTLKFSKLLMIKGNFEGKIIAENGHLFVDKEAYICADITAQNVSSRGSIYGNVNVEDKYELFSTGISKGDVSSGDLYIESGAKFSGKSNMKVPTKKRTTKKDNSK